MGRRPPTRRVSRALAPALAASLLVAPASSAGLILPEGGGSDNADDIRQLYVLILVIAVIVFAGVEGLLIWSMLKFRARKGRVAAQIHGNTRLEIGWTVGAALILVLLTTVTFVKLNSIKNPPASDNNLDGTPVAANAQFASTDQPDPPDPFLRIRVDGQQYVWRYQYPGREGVFAYSDMYVPTGVTVVLDITADDVAHSWWIPEMGGKMDALPGYVNKTWFKASEPGIYTGQCAELCGRNHANMYARVIARPPQEYQDWYRRQAQAIAEAREQGAEGRRRFEAEQRSTAEANAP